MGRIGTWIWKDRINSWVNLSTPAFYQQILIRKHPTLNNYAVSVWKEDGQMYLMNARSGSSWWQGMSKTKAIELARKFMRLNPDG